MKIPYNPQLVTISTEDGLNLPGLLYNPTKKTNKVAIYLHGTGSASVFYSVTKMNAIAGNINQIGVAFFPFNNRGAHYIKSFRKEVNGEKLRVNFGAAYELIRDCVKDIDAAIVFLQTQGFDEFYLIGSSTGANKIVLYDYLKKNNLVKKYILLSGGDDTGLYYQMLGKDTFFKAIKNCEIEIEKGNGEELVPRSIINSWLSYQSLYDIINPNGDYNIFPFNEVLNKLRLSKKILFREFKQMMKPTYVIYGGTDEYCYGNVPGCVAILKESVKNQDNFSFEIIADADHGFTDKEQELSQLMITYLLKD